MFRTTGTLRYQHLLVNNHHNRQVVKSSALTARMANYNHQPPTTYYEINLDHLVHNVVQLDRHVQHHARLSCNKRIDIMPVIKANAYGHGATELAIELLENERSAPIVHRLAVNRVNEGVELRKNLIAYEQERIRELRDYGLTVNERRSISHVPIHILGYGLPHEMQQAAHYNLTPAIAEPECLKAYCSAVTDARQCPHNSNATFSFHVKVDTGMGRFGLLPHEVLPFVEKYIASSGDSSGDNWLQKSGVQWSGMFTHFAVADELEEEDHIRYTRKQQYETFSQIKDQISERVMSSSESNQRNVAERDRFLFHCSNSAASIFYPQYHMDMVRPGVSIYGLSPRSVPCDPKLEKLQLKPVLSFKSHLARVKRLPKGSSISYGRVFKTPTHRDMVVGLVPVGYGDGYHRLNAKKGYVLVNGHRAPICGRICMDQFMVDLTDCGPNVQVNDEVTIIGKQGNEEITAEEVASWSETINYEVTTSLLNRAPRLFVHSE